MDQPDLICFGMFHFHEARKCTELLAERKIEYRDLAVLFVLISMCDENNCELRFSVKDLAAKIKMNQASLSNSLKRLKSNLLIASTVKNYGDKYYLINPYLFSVGRKQKWGHLVKLFTEAVN
jgi:DNA-binding transcriptional ArsR family regulator